MFRNIVVIAHDIRSTHNIGSLLRTCEGLGIERVYFTGYTPYPLSPNDSRLPHLAQKLSRQIHKTALGAEASVAWTHHEDIKTVISDLRAEDYTIFGLEQSTGSIALPELKPPQKVAVVLGREVEGLAADILAVCDQAVEIPMFGSKESFNVVQAAAMALYHLRFF